MTDNNPATPPQGATPGEGQGTQKPSTAAPVTPPKEGEGGQQGAQGGNNAPAAPAEGTVTIPVKEYRNLTRNNARYTSLQRRSTLRTRTAPANDGSGGSGDDGAGDPEFARIQQERDQATSDLIVERAKNGVRDLLERDEFKDIPESTKRILRKNPLSVANPESQSVDEVLLDIEDYLNEEKASVIPSNNNGGSGGQTPPSPGGSAPAGHETPPNVAGGGASSTDAAGAEDVSGLTGEARSRGVLRNVIRKGGGKLM